MHHAGRTGVHEPDGIQPSASLTRQNSLNSVPGLAWTGRVILAAWLVLYLFAVLGCVEPFPIWKKLDEAPYPVKVTALVTGSRSILNQQHVLTYGTWQVAFGNEAPTATAESGCSWRLGCEVKIHDLTCALVNGRAARCSLRLDTLDEACVLQIEEGQQKIGIGCPVDIIFACPQDRPTVTTLSTGSR